jgi:hypothetical protein
LISRQPFVALRHRNFRLIWIGLMVSFAGSMMQNAALLWHVSLLVPPERKGLALGMVGLVRVVPVILFSMISGVVADAWDRRKLMLFTQIAATIVAGALGWARHNGLTLVESARLLFGPTVASSSWSAANIARLLVPETGRVRPPDRDAPADYRRAISDLLLLLPAGSKELASSATAAADCLLHAIDRLNAESASLARDGSAADADRLSTQLAALGDGSSAESPERHELRELVRRQLEVVRRIRARHELVAQQRAHFFDMLRGLWTQLCAACDSAGDERTDVVSRKVRALCQEIVAEIESPPVGPPAVGALSA